MSHSLAGAAIVAHVIAASALMLIAPKGLPLRNTYTLMLASAAHTVALHHNRSSEQADFLKIVFISFDTGCAGLMLSPLQFY